VLVFDVHLLRAFAHIVLMKDVYTGSRARQLACRRVEC
jgi:hypothetical protein